MSFRACTRFHRITICSSYVACDCALEDTSSDKHSSCWFSADRSHLLGDIVVVLSIGHPLLLRDRLCTAMPEIITSRCNRGITCCHVHLQPGKTSRTQIQAAATDFVSCTLYRSGQVPHSGMVWMAQQINPVMMPQSDSRLSIWFARARVCVCVCGGGGGGGAHRAWQQPCRPSWSLPRFFPWHPSEPFQPASPPGTSARLFCTAVTASSSRMKLLALKGDVASRGMHAAKTVKCKCILHHVCVRNIGDKSKLSLA